MKKKKKVFWEKMAHNSYLREKGSQKPLPKEHFKYIQIIHEQKCWGSLWHMSEIQIIMRCLKSPFFLYFKVSRCTWACKLQQLLRKETQSINKIPSMLQLSLQRLQRLQAVSVDLSVRV